MEELASELRAAEREADVHVIVLKGAGRGFSAGYDMKESDPSTMGPGQGPSDGTHEPRGVPELGRGVWNSRAHVQGHIAYDRMIWDLWKPVIAQVHGFALAGASTLALACDLTLMSDDARIGYPPTRWLASGDNMAFYSYFAGLKIAREMSYGRVLSGIEAAQCGLITASYPEAELEERTMERAHRIAAINPELLMLNKATVSRVWELMGIKTAMEVSGEMDSLCHLSNVATGLRDALANKGNLRDALAAVNSPWGGV
jgi:enoyl-CoA hydratase